MPIQGGSCPLRACGTRFVAHKVAALERVVDRFGAYLSHIVAMTEDTSLKPADRQKLKGYALNRLCAKFIDTNCTRMAKLISTKEKLWLCRLIGASCDVLLKGLKLCSTLPKLICEL